MDKKDKIGISLRNVWRNFKNYRMCMVSIIISICVMGCFISVYEGTKVLVEKALQSNYERRQLEIYVGCSPDLDTDGWMQFTKTDIESLKSWENVQDVIVEYRCDIIPDAMSIGKMQISPPDYLQGVEQEFSSFTQAQIDSEVSSRQDTSYIVEGRDLKKEDTMAVILDENSVLDMGIKDYKSIVGKWLNVKFSKKNYKAKIVGIYSNALSPNALNDDATVVYDEENRISAGMHSAIFSKDVIVSINQDNAQPTEVSSIIVSSYNIEGILDVYEKLSSSIKNEIYCDAELMSRFQLYIKFFTSSFAVIGIVLFFFALYELYGIMRIVLEKRKKWFCIQRILGFTTKEITECYMIELATVELIGVTTGLFIMLIMDCLMNYMAKQYYGYLLNNTSNIFTVPIVFLFWIVIVSFLFVFLMGMLSKREIRKVDMDYIKREL